MGLLALLDEESKFPRANDFSLAGKYIPSLKTLKGKDYADVFMVCLFLQSSFMEIFKLLSITTSPRTVGPRSQFYTTPAQWVNTHTDTHTCTHTLTHTDTHMHTLTHIHTQAHYRNKATF